MNYNSPMNWIGTQLDAAQPPATIVHLGAGWCSELDAYLRQNPERIHLIEPNPELLPRLRQRAESRSGIHILPVAVSGQKGRQILRIFNEPDLSSLGRPTGLLQSMPGLYQTGQVEVDVIAAQDLPKALDLDDNGNNWLIIDTPGEESIIIDALAEHEQLHRFHHIVLRAGRSSIYQNAQTASELDNRLQKHGYEAAGRSDESDADWLVQHYRQNPIFFKYQRLYSKFEQSRSEFSARLEDLTVKKAGFELTISRQQKELKELSEERAQLKSQLEEMREKMERASKEHHAAVELAISRQQVKHQELRKATKLEVQALTEERTQLKSQLDVLRKQTEALRKQTEDEAKRHQAELEQQLHEVREAAESEKNDLIEQRQKKIETLEKELDKASEDAGQYRSNLSIALRLQNLRENDLKDLQQRYGELMRTNKTQRELLGKLHQRLSVAADYLRLINEQRDDQGELQDGLVRALTGANTDDT